MGRISDSVGEDTGGEALERFQQVQSEHLSHCHQGWEPRRVDDKDATLFTTVQGPGQQEAQCLMALSMWVGG